MRVSALSRMVTHLALLVACWVLAGLESGCTAVSTINEPPKKDLSLLTPGVHRDLVRAEFAPGDGKGAVTSSGPDYDVLRFPPGSTGWKYLRGVIYGVADFMTLGLAELLISPFEREIVVGDDRIVRVTYDAQQRVVSVVDLKATPGTQEPDAAPGAAMSRPPSRSPAKTGVSALQAGPPPPGPPDAVLTRDLPPGASGAPAISPSSPPAPAVEPAGSPRTRAPGGPLAAPAGDRPVADTPVGQPDVRRSTPRAGQDSVKARVTAPTPLDRPAESEVAGGAAAEPSVICYKPARKWANVRAAPAAKAPILRKATSVMRGTGERSESFVQVELQGGQVGWVHQSVIVRAGCP